MVIVSSKSQFKSYFKFKADIQIIKSHHTTIRANYEPMLHINNIKQSAKIINIEKQDVLRTGDRSKVTFQFMFYPVYLKIGNKIVFREGKIRGIGEVTELIEPDEK